MQDGIENAVARRGGHARNLFARARQASLLRADGGKPSWSDNLALAIARKAMFPSIRKKLGEDLRALICGSAPLSRETQLFFEMLGLSVLQVYGLTETTAICTMDRPGEVEAGRVGRAIEGIEMRAREGGEILVRGPHVFAGYWNRPEATASAFVDGWFRTGDTGDVDATGNWRVLGRLKNIVVLSSGHNVAPEPIEERLHALLPEASQIVVIGSGRPHLAVIVTGEVEPEEVESALEMLNLSNHPKVRSSIIVPSPFSIESGLVTANGKLRREMIATRLASEIDELYKRAKAERENEGVPA
jgi:long-chain acyl-CoA synthetase